MAKEVDIIVKATDKASDVLSGISQNSTKMADKINEVAKKVRNVTGVVTAGIVAMGKKRIDAGNNQIEQELKLTTVLKQRANATDEQIQKIKDLASAEQKLGIIGDEVQLAGAQQLATFVGQTETIETLLPAMNNLLAQQKGYNASAGDAVNIGNLMGKVLQGQTAALTRVGVTFTEAQEQVLKFGTEEERAAMLAQVITDNVGEMNKAMADTFQGRLTQVQNTIGDIGETLGMALMPALQNVLEKVTPIVEKIADWITNNQELAGKIILISTSVLGLTFALSSILPVLTSVITLLGGAGTGFVGVLGLVFAGLNLLESKIVSTDEQLAIYYQQVTDLNAAYDAGLISQEEYTLKMGELEQKISDTKEKSQTFGQYLKDGLNDILRNMTHIVQSSKQAFQDFGVIVNAVGGFFDKLAEKIGNFILKIVDALQKVKEFAKEVRENGLGSGIVSAGLNVAKNIVSKVTGKAVGGPVSANTPYVVGENGPELFVPSSSGNIVPNDQMGGIVVNVNFGGVAINNGSDEMSFAQTITQEITRELELYKKGIY